MRHGFDHKTLTLANLLVWVPMYRPLGETIYLAMYSLFGFQPAPLYVFCWLLLVANVFAAYALFRSLFDEKFAALTAVALIEVKAGLVADDDIDAQMNAVFGNGQGLGRRGANKPDDQSYTWLGM